MPVIWGIERTDIMKFDAYQMVTDRICELLEQGIKPWAKPWTSVMSCAWSGTTGKAYSLINQCMLADPKKKYGSLEELQEDVRGEWLTFKQAQARGGHVKAGEKGRKVVFYTPLEIEGETAEDKKTIPYLTAYTVFKISQCEGIEQKFHTSDDQVYEFSEDATAEEVSADYIKREGITYDKVKGERAYYSPDSDRVVIPLPEQFENRSEYYSTLFHELTHSTGHEKRLNRISKAAAFGNEVYSQEELVAEIGSASILATLGLENKDSFTNSAAYIKNWLSVLRNDKKMIVKATSQAEKAVRLILNIKEDVA